MTTDEKPSCVCMLFISRGLCLEAIKQHEPFEKNLQGNLTKEKMKGENASQG